MGSGAAAGGATLTQATQAHLEVDDSVVLKNDADEVVAVQIDDAWYAAADVEVDGDGALAAVEGAEALEVTESFTVNGAGAHTQVTEEFEGVESEVLKDGAGNVVAVLDSDNDTWYGVEGITEDTGALDFTDAEEVTVASAYQIAGAAGAGLGVGSLKVDNVTKESTGGIMSQDGASSAITTIQTAIETVSAERSKLGAYQNRLEHTINNLNTSSENLTAAESRIRDVDMAKEMMEQTKNSILAQASQAMLAQANQQPQGVLQLLR